MNKLITLIMFSLFATSFSFAQNENLSVTLFTKSEIKKLLGEFPTKNSPEGNLDYQTLIDWQNKRTSEECELADAQKDTNLEVFFVDNNGPLTKEEAKKAARLIFLKKVSAGANIYRAKNIYKRPRPYDAYGDIKPCIELEGSYSYPSGHSTIARFYALLLADMYPSKRLALLQRADEAAVHRMVGGVHYPSDVAAGKRFADALYQLLK